MPLRELDKEYRALAGESYEKRIEYCENLVKRMKGRLTDDYSDTSQIRSLMLEMIESAEKEIIKLKEEQKNNK